MKHTNETGRERVNQLRERGFFRFLGSPRKGDRQTFILSFDKKVYFEHFSVTKCEFKICLRLKAIQKGRYFQQDPKEPKYKALKIEISRFKMAEIAFSSDFRINHFGYDSEHFYDMMQKARSSGIISHVIE